MFIKLISEIRKFSHVYTPHRWHSYREWIPISGQNALRRNLKDAPKSPFRHPQTLAWKLIADRRRHWCWPAGRTPWLSWPPGLRWCCVPLFAQWWPNVLALRASWSFHCPLRWALRPAHSTSDYRRRSQTPTAAAATAALAMVSASGPWLCWCPRRQPRSLAASNLLSNGSSGVDSNTRWRRPSILTDYCLSWIALVPWKKTNTLV